MSTNREVMYQKYLAAKNCAEARLTLLNKIVKYSKSSNFDDKLLRGMLMAIEEVDSWITDYEIELSKKKKEENR